MKTTLKILVLQTVSFFVSAAAFAGQTSVLVVTEDEDEDVVSEQIVLDEATRDELVQKLENGEKASVKSSGGWNVVIEKVVNESTMIGAFEE